MFWGSRCQVDSGEGWGWSRHYRRRRDERSSNRPGGRRQPSRLPECCPVAGQEKLVVNGLDAGNVSNGGQIN